MITSYPTRSNGIIVLVNSQIGFLPSIFYLIQRFYRILWRAEVKNFVRKIFKLGALFSILGKTPTNGPYGWSF